MSMTRHTPASSFDQPLPLETVLETNQNSETDDDVSLRPTAGGDREWPSARESLSPGVSPGQRFAPARASGLQRRTMAMPLPAMELDGSRAFFGPSKANYEARFVLPGLFRSGTGIGAGMGAEFGWRPPPPVPAPAHAWATIKKQGDCGLESPGF